MLITFGEFAPDAPAVSGPNLYNLLNLVPRKGGFDTIRGSINTDYDQPTGVTRGALTGQLQDGTKFLIRGTTDALYVATGTSWSDISRASPSYTFDADNDRWEFAQYEDKVYAANHSDHVQVWDSTTCADLSADCSDARVMAVAENFLILGDIVGRGNNAAIGTLTGGLHWSALGDPSDWPTVATAEAAEKQSDYQELEGDGGAVTNIVPTADSIIVLRERQVWRMDYVGAPNIFTFRLLDPLRGSHIVGSAISVGNKVYFPSRQGWMMCDGFNVVPIGYEKIDEWWDGKIDLNLRHLMSRAHAPRWKSILWATPTTVSYPSLLLGYNYELNQWWTLQENVDWLVRLSPYGLSLDDAPYATYDMDVDLASTNLDTLTASDEEVISFFRHADRRIRTWEDPDNSNRKIGLIYTHDLVGPSPSRRYFVRYGRPHFNETDDVEGSIQLGVNFRNQLSDNRPSFSSYTSMNAYGTCPVRRGGRYGSVWLRVYAGIERVTGLELEVSQEGRR